jgi:hypothetical protein
MGLLSLIALFATALCLGGMVFFTAVVGAQAPRAMGPRYHLYVLGTAGGAAVALMPLSSMAAGLMLGVAGMAFWRRRVLGQRIDRLADRPEAAAELRRMQLLSRVANILQMAVVAAVLAGF